MDDQAPFGKQLRERRLLLGWSTATLAFHAAVTDRQVQNIEAGRTLRPHQSTMWKLEAALAKGERRRTMRTRVKA